MMCWIGRTVVSLAGHDKGSLYTVIGEECGMVLLADGKSRRLVKPKRKNIKHVLPLNLPRLSDVSVLTDGALRRKLRAVGEEPVS